MIQKGKMRPLLYKITFLSEHYADRKPSVVVVARDVPEAIETARAYAVADLAMPAQVAAAELLIPRWAESNTMPPDCLSKSALEYFQGVASEITKE